MNFSVNRPEVEAAAFGKMWHYQWASTWLYMNGCLVTVTRCIILTKFWPQMISKKWMPVGDCFLLILPFLLTLTVLGAYPLVIAAINLTLILAFGLIKRENHQMNNGNQQEHQAAAEGNESAPQQLGRQHFLDTTILFRSLFFHVVGIAILAVDFSAFPPIFKKTISIRVGGISAMDSGAAGYLFVNALSDYALEQKNISASKRALSWMKIGCVRVPMLLLILVIGFSRTFYLLISGYSYIKHEYGIHWNFLYTLFILRLMVAFISPKVLLPLGFLFGIFYQFGLSMFGLEENLLADHRVPLFHFSILDQNREGLFSTLGYCFFHSLTMLYAKFIHWSTGRSSRFSVPLGICANMFFNFVCLSILVVMQVAFGLVPSRRLANLPFVFGAMAIFTAGMAVLQLSFLIVPMIRPSGAGFVEATGHNGLVHLIASNLLTGLVNVALPVRQIRGNRALETMILLAHGIGTAGLVLFVHLIRMRSRGVQGSRRLDRANEGEGVQNAET